MLFTTLLSKSRVGLTVGQEVRLVTERQMGGGNEQKIETKRREGREVNRKGSREDKDVKRENDGRGGMKERKEIINRERSAKGKEENDKWRNEGIRRREE
jgi:hypothetical protein